MEVSNLLAERAQESANSMNDIAQKTKIETVSMRIITLVTLFFLPVTFISVGSAVLPLTRTRMLTIQQTIMSTDIIQFRQSDGAEVFQSKALVFLLAVSLPLIVVTFVAWYVVYMCLTRTDRHKNDASPITGLEPEKIA
jgi:hypothetical protein